MIINWAWAVWAFAMVFEASFSGMDSIVGQYLTVMVGDHATTFFAFTNMAILTMSSVVMGILMYFIYFPEEFTQDDHVGKCKCGSYKWECNHE